MQTKQVLTAVHERSRLTKRVKYVLNSAGKNLNLTSKCGSGANTLSATNISIHYGHTVAFTRGPLWGFASDERRPTRFIGAFSSAEPEAVSAGPLLLRSASILRYEFVNLNQIREDKIISGRGGRGENAIQEGLGSMPKRIINMPPRSVTRAATMTISTGFLSVWL